MKYSTKEKKRAVKVYKENGSISKTVRQTRYPKCRRMLYDWAAEYDKSGTVRDKRSGRTEIASYSREQIDKAVFSAIAVEKAFRLLQRRWDILPPVRSGDGLQRQDKQRK